VLNLLVNGALSTLRARHYPAKQPEYQRMLQIEVAGDIPSPEHAVPANDRCLHTGGATGSIPVPRTKIQHLRPISKLCRVPYGSWYGRWWEIRPWIAVGAPSASDELARATDHSGPTPTVAYAERATSSG
jgi:hypothetical protein